MRARHLPPMGRGFLAWRLVFVVATSLTPAVILVCAAGAQERGSGFRNLRVLPDDIGRQELTETMKIMTRSLGTDCRYCHRTDIPDFASDGVKAKAVAREMMQMVERMNRASPGLTVTCFTCHRGRTKPSKR
jgi:Photosynthetic reaction centre cytochrome C subunit